MPDHLSDRADFAALQAGHESALERIVARWEQPLFAFAWRYLRNAADAREVALDAFVRLHQQRARLRADTNLSAWLFTTVTNLCHNRHRWWRRHPTVSLDAPSNAAAAPARFDPPSDESTPEAALVDRETLTALDDAIARLPHDWRVTLLLHHFERLSYVEIAVITGCSPRGVETRLYRARQALREALSDLAPDKR